MIRPLRPEDVSRLAAALARLPLLVRYRRDARLLGDDLRTGMERGDGLLAEERDGDVRGLAWFVRGGTLGLGGYLKLLAVAPQSTGEGVGAALLAAFETEVAKASHHAFLLVSDFNEGAQRFYERHGYVRVGAVPGLVLPDVSEVVYWKRLAPAAPR